MYMQVFDVLAGIKEFSERVHKGLHKSQQGRRLMNTLVVGIGGSYLGAEFVYEALRTYPEAEKFARGTYSIHWCTLLATKCGCFWPLSTIIKACEDKKANAPL